MGSVRRTRLLLICTVKSNESNMSISKCHSNKIIKYNKYFNKDALHISGPVPNMVSQHVLSSCKKKVYLEMNHRQSVFKLFKFNEEYFINKKND